MLVLLYILIEKKINIFLNSKRAFSQVDSYKIGRLLISEYSLLLVFVIVKKLSWVFK